MTYKLNAKDMVSALNHITSTEEKYLLVDDENAAMELSQVYLDGGGNGSVTGPYLQPINNYPKRIWYVEK